MLNFSVYIAIFQPDMLASPAETPACAAAL
jgi:hypothetical protein